MTFLRLTVMLIIVGVVPDLARSEENNPQVDIAASVSTCGPHRQTIVALADRIIAEKHLAEGLTGSNFGTTAAYLKLRYQDMGLTEGLALLEAVETSARRVPRRLDVLRLAFAISHQGVDQGLTTNGDGALDAFAKHQSLLPRQMILADAGASYFRLLAETRADLNRAEAFDLAYRDGRNVPLLILDQDDAFKLEFARQAEARGELIMSALVLGSRSDLGAYQDFLGRHPVSDVAAGTGPLLIDNYLMTARYQAKPQYLPTDDTERKAFRRDMFDIDRASYHIGGYRWPTILTRDTGEIELIAAASRDFLVALEKGYVHPASDLEGAWIYFHTQLVEEMGEEALASGMSKFNMPHTVRHYAGNAKIGGNAADVLNWMQAIGALSDFVQGGVEPERPAILLGDFPWSAWVRIAEGLRSGGAASLTSAEAMDVKIGVELLYRAGDVQTAIDLAAAVMPNSDRLWIYRDFMQRLDLRCYGYTYYPGGGMVAGEPVLFWFDPR